MRVVRCVFGMDSDMVLRLGKLCHSGKMVRLISISGQYEELIVALELEFDLQVQLHTYRYNDGIDSSRGLTGLIKVDTGIY